jgi:septal ring factor EnvC (AmiA/AmiB activator)
MSNLPTRQRDVIDERLRAVEQRLAAQDERDKHLDATIVRLSTSVDSLTIALHQSKGAARVMVGLGAIAAALSSIATHFFWPRNN